MKWEVTSKSGDFAQRGFAEREREVTSKSGDFAERDLIEFEFTLDRALVCTISLTPKPLLHLLLKLILNLHLNPGIY